MTQINKVFICLVIFSFIRVLAMDRPTVPDVTAPSVAQQIPYFRGLSPEQQNELFKKLPANFYKADWKNDASLTSEILKYFRDELEQKYKDKKINISPISKGGYYFVDSPFWTEPFGIQQMDKEYFRKFIQNKSKSLSDPSALEATETVKNMAQDLVQDYKIHLMPKIEDVYYIINRLINEIHSNSAFRNLVINFKFKKSMTNSDLNEPNPKLFPRIVIYVSTRPDNRSGKRNAQEVLNRIYSLFNDLEGVDKTPRYNEKINSLIYYSQGDGDDKRNIKEGVGVFGPGKKFYDPMVTGQFQDYSLVNPALSATGTTATSTASAAAAAATTSTGASFAGQSANGNGR